jgi:hypothetical protein
MLIPRASRKGICTSRHYNEAHPTHKAHKAVRCLLSSVLINVGIGYWVNVGLVQVGMAEPPCPRNSELGEVLIVHKHLDPASSHHMIRYYERKRVISLRSPCFISHRGRMANQNQLMRIQLYCAVFSTPSRELTRSIAATDPVPMVRDNHNISISDSAAIQTRHRCDIGR